MKALWEKNMNLGQISLEDCLLDENGYICFEYSSIYPLVYGCAEYLSPEWLRYGKWNNSCDVWNLGILL